MRYLACLTAVLTAIPTSDLAVGYSANLDSREASFSSIEPRSTPILHFHKGRVAFKSSSLDQNRASNGHPPSHGQSLSNHAGSIGQKSSPGEKSPAGQSSSHKDPMIIAPVIDKRPSLTHGSSPKSGKVSRSSSIKASSTAKLHSPAQSSTYGRPSTSVKIITTSRILTSKKLSTPAKTPLTTSTVETSSLGSTGTVAPSSVKRATQASSNKPSTAFRSTSVTQSMFSSRLSTRTQSDDSVAPTPLNRSTLVGSRSSRSTSTDVSSSSTEVPTTTSSSVKATNICAGNTATDRAKWCDFSIDTDWNEEAPNTGVTQEYWLEITNITVSPDGYDRIALAINGTIPGPIIEANWGDTVKIHVTNSLTNNGTTIHWHGLRQNYTVQQDGVPSIIQCPDAPKTTHTYTWRATQYGTSWYHSHYALQAWEGVFGPLVIHGPATDNYDIDLGPVMINDWSHNTVDALYTYALTRGPPTLDTALINGKGTFNGTGNRHQMTFETGKKHRVRFINSAIDTHFKLSLDGHNMTVIAMDFVPVVPFSIEVLDITMGQRYDVIIEADQTATDYWFRAIPQASCSENDNTNDIRAIVRYDTNSTADPTSTAWSQTDACVDVSYSSLVPHVPHTVVDPALQNTTLAVSLGQGLTHVSKWTIGADSMKVIWNNPSLLQIAAGNVTWESAENAYLLPDANQWVYWVIDTAMPIPHPIHIHGHDFYILSQEAGATYNASTVSLNLSNPPRWDVANLPAAGYLVIAVYTDNPGTWLMHCHIGWHVAEGLALQFVERQSEIAALVNATEIESTCAAWNSFNNSTLEISQDDSGV